jgi:hypothetical protein
MLQEFKNLFLSPEDFNNLVETKVVELKKPAEANIVLNDGVEPKPHQPKMIKHILNTDHTAVLPTQTGSGKTFVTLYSISKMGIRCSVSAGASDILTWLKDIRWMYKNYTKDVIVVKGGKQLKRLIELGLDDDITAGLIIISLDTMRDYIKEFETLGVSSYGCVPSQFYNTIGVGFRAVDEAHQNLCFNFKHTINTNVAKILYLSATLESKSNKINMLYELIYPSIKRFTGLEWSKYTIVKAIMYNFHNPSKIRCIGTRGYSQNLFEVSIMSSKKTLDNYTEFVKFLSYNSFVTKRLDKQKLLVMVFRKDLAKHIADEMKKDKRFKRLTISDYTADHDEEVLHNHDIVISTPGSAGTGKDIKGLSVVLSTVSVDSSELNIQMVGRLRDLKETFPDTEPQYYYIYCGDIQKHVDYHHSRMFLLATKVKQILVFNSHYYV